MVATTLAPTRARATVVGSANGTRVINISDPVAPGSSVSATRNSCVHDQFGGGRHESAAGSGK